VFKKQELSTTKRWLEETRCQRPEEQWGPNTSILLSWRNRDARPWNHVFGMQYSIYIHGTRTGVLPGT